jgi:hypothetical protein
MRHVDKTASVAEEAQRTAVEDTHFRGQPFFFEVSDCDRALQQRGLGIASAAKVWSSAVCTSTSSNTDRHRTRLLSIADYRAATLSRKRLAPVVIIDALGHFVVGKPVLLNGSEPYLVVYNSSPGGNNGYIARPSMDTLVQVLYAATA